MGGITGYHIILVKSNRFVNSRKFANHLKSLGKHKRFVHLGTIVRGLKIDRDPLVSRGGAEALAGHAGNLWSKWHVLRAARSAFTIRASSAGAMTEVLSYALSPSGRPRVLPEVTPERARRGARDRNFSHRETRRVQGLLDRGRQASDLSGVRVRDRVRVRVRVGVRGRVGVRIRIRVRNTRVIAQVAKAPVVGCRVIVISGANGYAVVYKFVVAIRR